MDLNREQVVTLMNVFEGKQPVLIDHPTFEDPLPVKGVSMKDGQIILYCEKDGDVKEVKPVDVTAGTIYTDGACSGNPGPGGWAFAVYQGEKEPVKCQGGIEGKTTNQRAEIMAVIAALFYAKEQGINKITLRTDSEYVVKAMTGQNRRLANVEMWEQLDKIIEASKLSVDFEHVKGGSRPEQVDCDRRAKAAVPKR